jgi:hypothetical protein
MTATDCLCGLQLQENGEKQPASFTKPNQTQPVAFSLLLLLSTILTVIKVALKCSIRTDQC